MGKILMGMGKYLWGWGGNEENSMGMGLFFTMSFSRLQANLGEPAKRVCLFFCTEQNSEHITLQNCIKECCQTPRKMT